MEKELTGKYAKLRDDLRIALAAGRAAERVLPGDGGTCNFDSMELHLPRWAAAKLQQAAKEAGGRCFCTTVYGCKVWLFPPDTRGQADARSRNAEAMAEAMKEMGYDASVWYQMD